MMSFHQKRSMRVHRHTRTQSPDEVEFSPTGTRQSRLSPEVSQSAYVAIRQINQRDFFPTRSAEQGRSFLCPFTYLTSGSRVPGSSESVSVLGLIHSEVVFFCSLPVEVCFIHKRKE